MCRTETLGPYQVTAFGYKVDSRFVSDERLRVVGGANIVSRLTMVQMAAMV